MIKYVLVVILTSINGISNVHTQEFGNEESCKEAAGFIVYAEKQFEKANVPNAAHPMCIPYTRKKKAIN